MRNAVSADIPIMIVHQSGHIGVANSKALEIAGVTAETEAPPGGVIRRDENGDPNGVLEMRFSNDGASWSGWLPYAATLPWTLTPGDGVKTVYAEFRDTPGNVFPIEDDIILDTDAYQPVERRLGISRSLLEVLREYNRSEEGLVAKESRSWCLPYE